MVVEVQRRVRGAAGRAQAIHAALASFPIGLLGVPDTSRWE
jgi:hypothetical protein